MTKLDLAIKLSTKTGISIAESKEAVEGMISIFKSTFANGENIYIRGLGTFKVFTSNRTTARDIKNDKPITIKAKRKVKFIQSTNLKLD